MPQELITSRISDSGKSSLYDEGNEVEDEKGIDIPIQRGFNTLMNSRLRAYSTDRISYLLGRHPRPKKSD